MEVSADDFRRAAREMQPMFGGADGMGPGYARDFPSVDCPEKYDPISESFTLLTPCVTAGAGPHPVFANHPDHEMVLIGNRMLSSGGADMAVLPISGPKNLEWDLLQN